MMYVRLPLSLRNVEDLLHECGLDVSHETVCFYFLKALQIEPCYARAYAGLAFSYVSNAIFWGA